MKLCFFFRIAYTHTHKIIIKKKNHKIPIISDVLTDNGDNILSAKHDSHK